MWYPIYLKYKEMLAERKAPIAPVAPAVATPVPATHYQAPSEFSHSSKCINTTLKADAAPTEMMYPNVPTTYDYGGSSV